MKGIKLMFHVLCFAFLVFSFFGCAPIKELAKGIAGLSTKALEEGRMEAIEEVVACPYDKCYKQVREDLLGKGSYIYAEDEAKGMIAIYLSGEDTTPVGVFFVKVNEEETRIEVSSPNTHAREFIAARVSSVFKEKQEEELALEAGEVQEAPEEALAGEPEPVKEEEVPVMEGETVEDQQSD